MASDCNVKKWVFISVKITNLIMLFFALIVFIPSGCSRSQGSSNEMNPIFPIACTDGWFSFSVEGSHLFAVGLPKFAQRHVVNNSPLYLSKILIEAEPDLVTKAAPPFLTFSLKVSPFELGVFPFRNGIGFNDGTGILRALEVFEGGMRLYEIETVIELDGNHIESMSEEPFLAAHMSPIVDKIFIPGFASNAGNIVTLNTNNGQISSFDATEGTSAMYLFDNNGRPRLHYIRVETESKNNPYTVLFPDNSYWVPPTKRKGLQQYPEYIFHVEKTFDAARLSRGDYIIRGQFDQLLDRAIADIGKGVEELISIDERRILDIDFNTIGYSYLTSTVYWTGEYDQASGYEFNSSLEWVQNFLDGLRAQDARRVSLISASEDSERVALLVGYEIEGVLHISMISNIAKNDKKVCKLSPPGTPHTSSLLDFSLN